MTLTLCWAGLHEGCSTRDRLDDQVTDLYAVLARAVADARLPNAGGSGLWLELQQECHRAGRAQRGAPAGGHPHAHRCCWCGRQRGVLAGGSLTVTRNPITVLADGRCTATSNT